MPARLRNKLIYRKFSNDDEELTHILEVQSPMFSRPDVRPNTQRKVNRQLDRSNVATTRNGLDTRLTYLGELKRYRKLPSGMVFTCPDAEIKREHHTEAV
jgi:hypothetical protein